MHDKHRRVTDCWPAVVSFWFFGPAVKGHQYKPKGESSPFNANGPSQTGSVGIA